MMLLYWGKNARLDHENISYQGLLLLILHQPMYTSDGYLNDQFAIVHVTVRSKESHHRPEPVSLVACFRVNRRHKNPRRGRYRHQGVP